MARRDCRVARVVRGVVLSLKQQDFVLAARCVGAPAHQIVLRHLLPNAMAPMIVATTLGAGMAINAETAEHADQNAFLRVLRVLRCTW